MNKMTKFKPNFVNTQKTKYNRDADNETGRNATVGICYLLLLVTCGSFL